MKLIGQPAAKLWGFLPTAQLAAVTVIFDPLTLKLVHEVRITQGPFLSCSVFLGYSVFALSGAPRGTDGRTDGGNGRCHGNEVTRGKAARGPYDTCQIWSWSVNRRWSYGDYLQTAQLAAVTLAFDPLTLKLVHGVLVSQGPFLPSSVFLGHFVFALDGGTRRTNGRTDGPNGRCDGNEVTRCKAARDPYATCQISSWSDNRRRSYEDFSPTTQLAAVTLTSDPLTLKLIHGMLVSQGPFLPSLVFVGLFVFPLGENTGQTNRQTDGQDQHMMGPPSRKDGPIITLGRGGIFIDTSVTVYRWKNFKRYGCMTVGSFLFCFSFGGAVMNQTTKRSLLSDRLWWRALRLARQPRVPYVLCRVHSDKLNSTQPNSTGVTHTKPMATCCV